MASYGTDLIDIMNTSGDNYSSKFRNEIVKALILLRGKEMVPAQPLYELFFKLFRVKDQYSKWLFSEYGDGSES